MRIIASSIIALAGAVEGTATARHEETMILGNLIIVFGGTCFLYEFFRPRNGNEGD